MILLLLSFNVFARENWNLVKEDAGIKVYTKTESTVRGSDGQSSRSRGENLAEQITPLFASKSKLRDNFQ
jgi:hypothetical protein